jgi:hypothetical protein
MRYLVTILIIVMFSCCKKTSVNTPSPPVPDTTNKKDTLVPPPKVDPLAKIVGEYYGDYHYYKSDYNGIFEIGDTIDILYASRLVVTKSADTSLVTLTVYDKNTGDRLWQEENIKLINYSLSIINVKGIHEFIVEFSPANNSVHMHKYWKGISGSTRSTYIDNKSGDWKW